MNKFCPQCHIYRECHERNDYVKTTEGNVFHKWTIQVCNWCGTYVSVNSHNIAWVLLDGSNTIATSFNKVRLTEMGKAYNNSRIVEVEWV
jgi:hypothetical protein